MSPTKATSASTAAAALSDRDPNTMSPTKSGRQTDDGQTKVNAAAPRFDCAAQKYKTQTDGTYISPSDAIRSPTTKKLSEIKGKRYMSAKPQTLFAKTLSQQSLKNHPFQPPAN